MITRITRSLLIAALRIVLTVVIVAGPLVNSRPAQAQYAPQPGLPEMAAMLIGDWRSSVERIVFQPGGRMMSSNNGTTVRGTYRLLNNGQVHSVFRNGFSVFHFISFLSGTQLRLQTGTTFYDFYRAGAQGDLSRWGNRQYVDGRLFISPPVASAPVAPPPPPPPLSRDSQERIPGASQSSSGQGDPAQSGTSGLWLLLGVLGAAAIINGLNSDAPASNSGRVDTWGDQELKRWERHKYEEDWRGRNGFDK